MVIYLDHNATTPIDPRVIDAMKPYLYEIFGNPSSVEHQHGHDASAAIERAREQTAAVIGAKANEIVFTASCTEADNMAVLGVARANSEKRHIITSAIEHPAVLEPIRMLEREGWSVTYLPVDEKGQVSVDGVKGAIRKETALVSIMAANNEVGSLQPIRSIGAVCAEREVLFHVDLAQVVAYHEVDVERDNIHLASLSGHKAYGPKGVGVLYVRSRRPRVRLAPILFGGGQERGLRPGTLNTTAIVGMGEAMAIARSSAVKEGLRLSTLCQRFLEKIRGSVEGASLNGPEDARLANNISLSVVGVEPLALIRRLNREISFSASSACATDKIQTSHVLLAMFGETARARQAFRIAPGRFTTESDIDLAADLLISEIARLRGG
ncbi:cysteine desulfurase DndA [Rhizobium sp. AU243]|uniref:cysteine desulfurase DndA n=1 Tax=Rhizobium sp. AU243 TaxID=2303425 RepID=UPI0010CB21E7|nr:cysteine desulfurase DndA [Rhizobium sp. AU243]TKV70607.1 cysteine desulfurase DndA [Rhizobium sp. AU243]